MGTLLTADCNDDKYMDDHVKHFFNTVSYDIACSFSQEDKERLFKMLTDHEVVATKLLGPGFTQSSFFLPVANRNGLDNSLIQEYKVWLEKQ